MRKEVVSILLIVLLFTSVVLTTTTNKAHGKDDDDRRHFPSDYDGYQHVICSNGVWYPEVTECEDNKKKSRVN